MDPQQIHLRPARIALVLGAAVLVLVAFHFVGYFHSTLVGEGPITYSFAPKFDLDGEQTVPAFFSSLLLLFAALTIFSIASDPRTTALRTHWWVLGAIFAFMAVDEAAGFHELLIMPLRSRFDLPSWLHYAWVIPVAVLVILFALAYLRFLLALPRRYQALFVLAGVLYVGGALGMEMLGAATRGSGTYELMMALEETLEMTGATVFIYTLLTYKGQFGSPVLVRIGDEQRAYGKSTFPKRS